MARPDARKRADASPLLNREPRSMCFHASGLVPIWYLELLMKKPIGIIVNGATGRIASTQHLANALVPIINEGGLALGDDRLLPRLLLVGRDADRVAAIARAHKVTDWTTDLGVALASPD